jgi:hypothetical protein
VTRYDEQHLREIMATVKAPPGLREKALREKALREPPPTVAPTSPARPPRPRWPLPVIVGAAALGLMFGSYTVASRMAVTPRPPGTVGSSVSPSAGPSPAQGGPSPSATPGPSGGPGRNGDPSPVAGPAGTQSTPPVPGVGVPAGTVLTLHSGDLHVSTAGATVSNMQVVGTVYVEAPDVTLVNVRVTQPSAYFGIKQEAQATNLTVRDSEVIGDPADPPDYAISQSVAGLTVTRVLIRHANSGIHLGAGSVTVTSSRIDQLAGASPVGIGSTGDTPNLTFTDNTILVDADAGGAIVLYTNDGPDGGVLIQGNTLAGGATALVGAQHASSHDIKVLNNRFSRMYYPTCGSNAPVSAYDPAEPGNQWSGNVWADTGQPVEP